MLWCECFKGATHIKKGRRANTQGVYIYILVLKKIALQKILVTDMDALGIVVIGHVWKLLAT